VRALATTGRSLATWENDSPIIHTGSAGRAPCFMEEFFRKSAQRRGGGRQDQFTQIAKPMKFPRNTLMICLQVC